MEKIKINFNKVKKIPIFLAEKAFLVSILFIFLSLILGTIVFYKYGILVQKFPITIQEKPSNFKEKDYHEMLKILQEREEKFNNINFEQYPDLFKTQH